MAVGTWQDLNFQVDNGTTYKTGIDNDHAVAKRIVDRYAPHAKATPDMNILVDAGFVFNDQTFTNNAQQTVGPFTAPVSNPRIDRVVIDRLTGVASIIAGTEAGSPVAPAIPEGKDPCAQIALATSTTSITNALITDERTPGGQAGATVQLKSGTDQTVVNTVTETTITAATKTIAAGSLGTDNWVEYQIDISDFDLVNGHTCTLRAKYDGTTFATLVITTPSGCVSTSNANALIKIGLRNDGATNVQRGWMVAHMHKDLAISSSGVPYNAGSAAKDSTTAKDLTFTVQFSNANASSGLTISGQRGVKYQ